MFPKTQDQTLDRLLAAQGRAPGNAASLCSTFDADLASAYVERRLSASETAGFESHLAACPPCRKAIIMLARLALAEAEPARPNAAVGRVPVVSPVVSPVRRWLGLLATPQWAVAAAAAIVLAIALPLVLSHRPTSNEQAPSTETPSAQTAPASPVTEPAPGAISSGAVAVNNAAPEAREKSAPATSSDKPAAVASAAKDLAAGATAGAASGGAATAAQPTDAKTADQTVAKNETPPAAPAPAAEAPKSEEKAKTEVADDRKAAPPATTQPARDEDRAKSDSAVAAETIAPPPPPPRRTFRRGGDTSRSQRNDGYSGPASAFRSSGGEPRVPSRKVGGHQFWLHDGTWTDREFDSTKNLPHTNVKRDSDIYRELLAKKEKIKPFLTEFPADARVIFVFDGMVYILIPQQ